MVRTRAELAHEFESSTLEKLERVVSCNDVVGMRTETSERLTPINHRDRASWLHDTASLADDGQPVRDLKEEI